MGAAPKYAVAVPSLDEIARDPSRVDDLPTDVAMGLLLRVHTIEGVLGARVADGLLRTPKDGDAARSARDTLLTADEAAKRVGMSVHWLYHNAGKLPFTVRQGRALRFSANGIEKYIAARRGR